MIHELFEEFKEKNIKILQDFVEKGGKIDKTILKRIGYWQEDGEETLRKILRLRTYEIGISATIDSDDDDTYEGTPVDIYSEHYLEKRLEDIQQKDFCVWN